MDITIPLLGLAIIAGAFGAILGVGGGIIIVPGLTLILGVPIHVAIGSSITAVIATSSAATLSYILRGYVNLRLGMLLEVPTVIGAVFGGLLAVALRGEVLQFLFAGILIYASIVMARPAAPGAAVELEPETGGWLTATFREPTTGGEVYYNPRRAGISIITSVAAGAASGLLGVGGGIVKVPLMSAVMAVPVRAAMATSSFMIGLTGAASAFIYYSHGYAPPEIAGPTAIGVLIGARAGSKIFRRLRPRALMLLFVGLLLFSAVRMILEALG